MVIKVIIGWTRLANSSTNKTEGRFTGLTGTEIRTGLTFCVTIYLALYK